MIPKIICTYCFAAAAIFSSIYLPFNTSSPKKTVKIEPETEENISITIHSYTIKQHNGKISVFTNDKNEPIYTLDSPYIRDLPKYDQEILEKGITVNSKEELIKTLEDYDNWLSRYSQAAKKSLSFSIPFTRRYLNSSSEYWTSISGVTPIPSRQFPFWV